MDEDVMSHGSNHRKVLCVVGARPNFMKAAPVVDALRRRPNTQVVLVHTGQHYDRQMSGRFLEDLGMPTPDIDLRVGSASHGEQTGRILIRLEPVLREESPALVIVFGDVNSTLAAALCASKMGIKVAHVEAGLRSFDRTMPEEVNRILTDHISDYLFTTEPSGAENLLHEGILEEKIFFVGNTMVDTLLKHKDAARALDQKKKLGMSSPFGVLTLHRPNNVDGPESLGAILGAVAKVAEEIPIVFPCHPRTRARLLIPQLGGPRAFRERVRILEPLGYLEFISLISDASFVLTDSGGIQEESTVLGIPCLTVRNNTERPVTLSEGTNVLVGAHADRIVRAVKDVLTNTPKAPVRPELWDGQAAERIAQIAYEVVHESRGVEHSVA